MRSRLAVTAVSLFALATILEAQPSATAFEVSPFAGYLFGGYIYDFPPFQPLGVADHLNYGIRLGYDLPSGLEPEIEWSRSETHFDLHVSRPYSIFQDLTGLTINYALAGLTYNLSRDRIRPYVSLALGAARLSPVSVFGSLPGETDFTGSLGVGLKTFVTPAFGFRFEARGYGSKLNKPPIGINCTVGGPVGPACPSKTWLLNGEISGGLLFSF